MNNCSFIGRVGRDAVTRFTQGGKAVTGFALAVDKGFGERKTTTWVDYTIWGDRGEKVASMILKGDRIGVQGEMGTREHEGKVHVTLDVKEVTLLGAKRDGAPAAKPARKADPLEFEDDALPDF